MAASVEYKNVMKEKDDDLSVFFEMSNLTMGRNDLSFLHNSDDFDDSFGSKPKITSVDATVHGSKTQADEFLDSENGKTDYDWLLTPPCTPLEKGLVKATGNAKSQTNASKPRLAEPHTEPAPSKVTSSRKTRSSSAGTRRSSSSGGGGSVASRHDTPTGRPTLPAPVKPLRSSTPSSRKASIPCNNIVAPHKWSSTLTNSTARSSTPTGRPSILAASKSASPTPCQLSDQSSSYKTSVPACNSSSVTKSGATSIKQRVQSRGISPTVKSKPQKSSELPGFSTGALPNSKASLSGRTATASKERPCTPNSTETGSSGKQRQKSYLSSKAKVLSGRNVLLKCRSYSNTDDDVNPVLMGTQMVERVVNMRKLAPPKQDDFITNHSITSRKPSQESFGFGRSLSKKSLDMAMRHMDITRSISGNMRSLMKDVPASSVYSLRSEYRKVGISGSTYSLKTNSDASSEHSCNINSNGCLNSSVDDIDIGSEQGHSSSNSQPE